VGDHYEALQQHVSEKLFTYVVANNNITNNGLGDHQSEPVQVDQNGSIVDAAVVAADVISEENRYYHDTSKLASLLMALYYQPRDVAQSGEPVRESQEVAAL
jgi:2-phospho-L-lactate transferase/gluconeogenesis factor (CofD/UPF0052 family)